MKTWGLYRTVSRVARAPNRTPNRTTNVVDLSLRINSDYGAVSNCDDRGGHCFVIAMNAHHIANNSEDTEKSNQGGIEW